MTLHNTNAEQCVIGACLLDRQGAIRAEILAEVRPSHMWRGAHATALAAIARLHSDGKPLDAMTVDDALVAQGVSEPTLLADCMQAVPTAAHGLTYARTVASLARRRMLADTGRGLVARAEDMTADVDAAVADTSDALSSSAAGQVAALDRAQLVEGALEALEREGEPLGWAPPWKSLARVWRLVPGWVHVVIGFRSCGKSALLDAMLVGLAESDDVRTLIWSPEGAPTEEHLARMARVHANAIGPWAASSAVRELTWCAERVSWLDHERHPTLSSILAAADAHRARNRMDVLVIDPFTSVSKFDGPADEAWDRALNRHLSRMQSWARSREVALVVVAHPKQCERVQAKALDGGKAMIRPVATDAHIHGGMMWGNQTDSLISVWRDETGATRSPAWVDVHVQKIRHEGRGGQMGRKVTLRREPSGQYTQMLQEAI